MKITVQIDDVPQKIKSVNIEFFDDGTVGVIARPTTPPETFSTPYGGGTIPCSMETPKDTGKYGWDKVNEVDINSTASDFEYDKILAKREKPAIIGKVEGATEELGPDLSHITNREENIADSMTEKF